MHRNGDEALLERLRSGDETAFAALVDQLNGSLYALARTFTSSPALAEDIVQETWLAAIRGLRGFQGRSLLRTWIFGILVRRARTMAVREKKMQSHVPLSSGDGEVVEWSPGLGRVGLWEGRPAPWPIQDPAALYQDREIMAVVNGALAAMPKAQSQVVQLRDVEGLSAAEACNVLEISETNQRVLLHRGRARVRTALDRYFRGGDARLQASPRNGTIAQSPHLGAVPDNSQKAKESSHGR